MEKGERAASSEELLELAAALSIELNDLPREHVVLAQISPRFRAGDAEVDAVIARLLALAEQYAELEQVARVARAPAPLEHLRERGKQHFPIADLSALARLYDVSIGRMALRLEELQLLPPGTYDGLRKKTFKVNEPIAPYGAKAGLPGLELPQRYRRLAFEMFAEGSISEAELAKFLHTDRMQSRRGYLEWLAQLNEGGALEVDPAASLAKVR
jgi:hypothetical protein